MIITIIITTSGFQYDDSVDWQCIKQKLSLAYCQLMKAKKIKPGVQPLENRVLLPTSCHMDKMHAQFMPYIHLQIILHNRASSILKEPLVNKSKFTNRFGFPYIF